MRALTSEDSRLSSDQTAWVDASRIPVEPTTRIEALALIYLALPTIVFLAGWITMPVGLVAALALGVVVAAILLPSRGRWAPGPGPLLLPIVVIASLWAVMGGVGHFVYANQDWVVRDAVLRDLVVDRWPVVYRLDGIETLLRAPIGYFLPAAAIGKLFGLRTAEHALLAWTTAGVVLVFAMMLRDRPTPKAAMIRIVVFIAFSGMDIVGTLAHYNPHALGDHLEWWAFIFQYSSQTTQLFWVPNHALPGWIAVAWLLGRDLRRLPVAPAVLFVLLVPIWSPLTAIGVAPLVGAGLLARFGRERVRVALRALIDWKIVVATIVCLGLVYPYLTAGSDKVASGANSDLHFVGEQIVPRYIEFVLFEFAGFAVLLLRRDPRDALTWAAVVVLLALPIYRFGPYNDLAMRASIAPLTLLAIRTGDWLSTPRVFVRGAVAASVAVVLLGIGAVTPFMEFARVFIEPAWSMNEDASVPDVTRGTHYLTPLSPLLQSWPRRFVAPSPVTP